MRLTDGNTAKVCEYLQKRVADRHAAVNVQSRSRMAGVRLHGLQNVLGLKTDAFERSSHQMRVRHLHCQTRDGATHITRGQSVKSLSIGFAHVDRLLSEST